mgnify:CR=1 FL=1
MAVDKILVRELELFGDNDSACYKKLMAINENYALKRKRGVWNKEKAIKGLTNLYSPFVVSRYRKEFGLGTVSKEDKRALAKETYKTLWDDYGLKNIKKARKVKKKKRK